MTWKHAWDSFILEKNIWPNLEEGLNVRKEIMLEHHASPSYDRNVYFSIDENEYGADYFLSVEKMKPKLTAKPTQSFIVRVKVYSSNESTCDRVIKKVRENAEKVGLKDGLEAITHG